MDDCLRILQVKTNTTLNSAFEFTVVDKYRPVWLGLKGGGLFTFVE